MTPSSYGCAAHVINTV